MLRKYNVLLAIIAGFTIVSVACILFSIKSPSQLMNDALEYDLLGWNLAKGNGYRISKDSPPAVFRTPGYPAFLALSYMIFGHSLLTVFFFHAFLHACTVFFSARIAERVFKDNRLVSQLVPWIVALYPFAIHAATLILSETLATFLLVLAIYYLLRPATSNSCIAGIVIGMLILVRPIFLFFPFFLIVVLGMDFWRNSLLFLTCIILVIAPWTIRNSWLTERVVLVSVGGIGNNLLIGSWEYRDLSKGIPLTTDFDQPGYHNADQDAIDSVKDEPYTPQWYDNVDRARMQRGIQEIKNNPLFFFRATSIRIIKLWVSQYLPGLPLWVCYAIALLCICLLLLMLIGMHAAWPLSGEMWLIVVPIIYLTVIHAPLHAEARYTLPARPFMLMFATLGIIWFAGRIKHLIT